MAKEKETGLSSFEELAKSDYAKDLGFDYESAEKRLELEKFKRLGFNLKSEFSILKDKESILRGIESRISNWNKVIKFINELKNLTNLKLVINQIRFNIESGINPPSNYYEVYIYLTERLNIDSFESSDELITFISKFNNQLKLELKSKKIEYGIHAYSDALNLYREYRAQISESTCPPPLFSETKWQVTSKDQYRKVQISKKIVGYFERSLTPPEIIKRLQNNITRFEV